MRRRMWRQSCEKKMKETQRFALEICTGRLNSKKEGTWESLHEYKVHDSTKWNSAYKICENTTDRDSTR